MKLTEYLAIYASILSTIVFLWNYLSSRPRLKVKIIYGVEEKDSNPIMGIYVSAQNVSNHKIHLSNISLLYPFNNPGIIGKLRHMIQYKRLPKNAGWVHTSLLNYGIDDRCPISLEARKSHQVFVSLETIEQILDDATVRKIRAVVQDELWINTYSKRFKVDINNA